MANELWVRTKLFKWLYIRSKELFIPTFVWLACSKTHGLVLHQYQALAEAPIYFSPCVQPDSFVACTFSQHHRSDKIGPPVWGCWARTGNTRSDAFSLPSRSELSFVGPQNRSGCFLSSVLTGTWVLETSPLGKAQLRMNWIVSRYNYELSLLGTIGGA